ncbi:MAG: ABC transporter permease [Holophagales bacterium]|nr:ABC transporter permease [Holophagales bacterium]
MIQRDLKARYRGSVLGFVWSLVNPLLLLLVYWLVFNYIFSPRDPSIQEYGPYALFLATGVIPWIWIQTAWLEGTMTLLANAGLIRKASFPAELLPVVSVLANLVHLLLAMPILILAFVVTDVVGDGTRIGWTASFLPLVALVQIPFVCGLTLATAALNVHFKDVRDILQNLTTLLFFMTPILYSLEALAGVPPLRWLVAHNPMTPFLLAYQEALFFGRPPSLGLWLVMAALAAATFAAGAWLFERLSETLGEAV